MGALCMEVLILALYFDDDGVVSWEKAIPIQYVYQVDDLHHVQFIFRLGQHFLGYVALILNV